jgi:hypothetical protein
VRSPSGGIFGLVARAGLLSRFSRLSGYRRGFLVLILWR